ncbi:hypothetical protein F4553_000409 [Allocatelliglobosispora scoriae]|uniref:YCII-related domain-containing protein n=1 Tax=Allocatelliglobosispora scoriae TaxID=643052 RepID=A0A841BJN4_9ACTN|nr:YciI family protein [Allocatelliglobosispora scoriae]MBB5867030.1 hypothetical protein [Allocatelliglobosispora scoriae]
MKYLMLVCVEDKGAVVEAGRPAGVAPVEVDIDSWVEEMDGRGARLMGDRVRPGSDATVVRVVNGEVLLTDGPYAETKDLIAGFDVIECADLDEAIQIAAKHPMSRGGVLELRAFWTD